VTIEKKIMKRFPDYHVASDEEIDAHLEVANEKADAHRDQAIDRERELKQAAEKCRQKI
jgi:hypothetical protein